MDLEEVGLIHEQKVNNTDKALHYSVATSRIAQMLCFQKFANMIC